MRPWPFFVAFAILLGTLGFMKSVSQGEVRLQKTSFADFPLNLANRWEGRELGVAPDVLDILKVSDYMMRYYQPNEAGEHNGDRNQLQPVSLYVGYYESQRSGATYHSPKNCLPGSGWNFADTGTASIPITDPNAHHHMITINKVLIQKGREKQMVLYWYHDRGRIIASEYMAKVYMIWDSITHNRTDGALVRIIVPVHDSPEKAFENGVTFLNDIWPELIKHMPSAIPT